jgi:lipoprotein-releasing system ATP-binding protein
LGSDFVISAKKIFKSYTTHIERIDVLKGLDLELEKGEVLSICGPSGSGKTTLLNILGTLDFPNEGSLKLFDEEIDASSLKKIAEIRKKIGFVFQFHHLLAELSVLENVMLPLLIRRIKKTHAEKEAIKILEEIQLERFRDHLPSEISGGQQQKVAIARAVIGSPELILADEPTGNLDANWASQVFELLCNLARKKRSSVVIVTHNETLADQADRKLYLKEGKLTIYKN